MEKKQTAEERLMHSVVAWFTKSEPKSIRHSLRVRLYFSTKTSYSLPQYQAILKYNIERDTPRLLVRKKKNRDRAMNY